MTLQKLRGEARALFQRAVAAADPATGVRQALLADLLAPTRGRLVVLALGKAAPAMMAEALIHLPSPNRALVVTNAENMQTVQGAEVLVGEHPVPDAGSVAAGAALLDAVRDLGPDDQVLALISGGGSALGIAPIDGVSIKDKQAVNAVLLGSGLDINQMNLVRQSLSQLKGGGLARAAAPAQVRALILSDVIGDDLRVVASGPTVGRVGSNADARAVLQGASVWNDMPLSVRKALSADIAMPAGIVAHNQIIGSNRVSLDAISASCDDAVIVDDRLEGDVSDAAAKILHLMALTKSSTTLIFGGETTVKIKGNGIGGRNQELALRVALGSENLPGDWVFLSGGTDGRDGPTDAAGGLVDAGTVARIRASGLDPVALLANNDSYKALKSADDLLIIGGTGTNVADVQLFLRRS